MRSARRVRARAAGGVFVFALLAGLSAEVVAQRNQHEKVISRGPEIEQSPIVSNLFRTAEQATEREDWKLAIDSLQRVIESPSGLLKTVESTAVERFESPRLKAYRMLAALPDAGREAYGVLFDGRAKGLLDRARETHDLVAARRAVDLYMMSRHGGEAVRLLSSWLLDAGRASEALEVLQAYWSVFPEAGRNLDWLVHRQAVAYAMLGDRAMGAQMLGLLGEAVNDSLTEQVRAYVLSHELRLADPVDDLDWTGPGGGGLCTRRMSRAVPTMAEELPWRRGLPHAPAMRWTELDGFGADALPVAEPIVYDDRLYLKSGSVVQAVDLLSFTLAWSSGSAAIGIAERFGRGSGFVDEHQLFRDYVEGTVSAGAGLIFSVESGDRAEFDSDGVAVLRSGNRPRAVDVGRRLVAYDARTGRVRWRRGGLDDDEAFRDVLILAPPVVVGDEAWVPFESANAVILGVFDVADGRLLDQVVLYALGGRSVRREWAMFSAVDDGVIYLSTGFGLLMSVEADTRQLRWATRYREHDIFSRRSKRFNVRVQTQPTLWFPSPPMVAGSLVLLAPPDDDRMIAFDRTDGTLVWDWPREDHRYLIGTDGERVWLGGEDITCLSLGKQDLLWTQPVEDVTGRAALSGGRIYQPTETAMASFDALTGETGELIAIPASHPPLGNVLFTQGAMISVDPSEARSYPDLSSYEVTLAAHRVNPEDPRTAIRLAFLELLNKAPQKAIDALRDIKLPPDDAMARHVAHLRVEALLNLAARPGTAIDQSVDHLRLASRLAASDRDRVQSRLALGDTLRRMGRYREAYETLWRMGMDPLADEFVVQGEVKRSARAAAADVLLRIEPELGPDEAKLLAAGAKRVFDEAVGNLEQFETRSEATRALRRLAGIRTLGGWGQASLNALAGFEVGRGRFERAEQYLNESMRFGSSREKLAEALLLEADLYLAQSPAMSLSARRSLDRLESEFADVQVGGRLVARIVADKRKRVDELSADWHERVTRTDGFELAGREAFDAFDDETHPLAMVDFRMAEPEASADRQIVFAGPRTLRSYDVAHGTMEWEAELLMTYDFAYGLEDVGSSSGEAEIVTGWSDGQTMVVNGPKGLHAVGVVSGLRLWAVPIDGRPYLREFRTDVGSGRLACMIRPTELAVLSMLDGSVLWRRDLGFEPGGVYVRDDYVMTIDADTEHIRSFRLSNGAGLGEVTFKQPDSLQDGGEFIPVTYHEGVVCGPVEGGLAAYDVRSGLEEWTLALDWPAASSFEPAPGKILVASRTGVYRLLDVLTGDVEIEGRLENVDGLIVDGGIHSDLLMLAAHTEAVNGDRWTIVAIDANDGGERWRYGLSGFVHRPSLRSDGDLLVFMEHLPADIKAAADRSRLYTDEQAVVLLDKDNGRRVGSPSVWSGYVDGNPLRSQMSVKSGRIVLQASRGIGAMVTRATSGMVGGVD